MTLTKKDGDVLKNLLDWITGKGSTSNPVELPVISEVERALGLAIEDAKSSDKED